MNTASLCALPGVGGVTLATAIPVKPGNRRPRLGIVFVDVDRLASPIEGVVLTPELDEPRHQRQMLRAGGTGGRVIAPVCIRRGELLRSAYLLVEVGLGPKIPSLEAGDPGRLFVGAKGAARIRRAVRREVRRGEPHGLAAFRVVFAEDFGLTLVEGNRIFPVLLELAELFEGAQRLEIAGVGLECGLVGAGRTFSGVHSSPADLTESAIQGGPLVSRPTVGQGELQIEGAGDLGPVHKPFREIAQSADRLK